MLCQKGLYRHQLKRYSTACTDNFRKGKLQKYIVLGYSPFCCSFLHSTRTYFRLLFAVCITYYEKQGIKLEYDTGE